MIERRRLRIAILTSTALAAALMIGAQDAAAQNLFERLFQINAQRHHVEPEVRQARQPEQRHVQPRRTPPAQAPRVSGPQYYTYKTDELVRIDFSAIMIDPAVARTEIDHGTVGATARVAIAGESLEDAVEKVLASETTGASATNSRRRMTETKEAVARRLEIEVRRQGKTLAVTRPSPSLSDRLNDLADFELYAEKAIGDAVVAHYSNHPDWLWSADGRINRAARDVLRELGKVDAYGLNPADYAVSLPQAGDAAALARFEMALTSRLLRYARDVHAGRVDPNRISGYHDLERKSVDYAGLLAAVAKGEDVREALRALHPQNPFYKAMQVELEQLRAGEETDVVIAPGTLIRPGQTHPELPKILAVIEKEADAAFLAQHGEAIERNLAGEIYGDDLVPVVKAAQAKRGLQVDGIIGPRTITAFAGESKASRIEKVELAMEQLRWLPSEFGDRYVFLNTPSATASYVGDGQEKLSMRTVVGSKGTQTYFFQDEISYVEFHPYWGVPHSIVVNKYLPKLYADPSYLDRSGFEVTDRQGRRVASASVDWTRYGANIPYHVRQRPGPTNALGELKIMFPNEHAIYMHDTPDRHLFQRDNRALSNGCVRLEDPRAMAAAVLGWDRGQIDHRLDQPHSRADLDVKVPVYVAYFTAWPTADGKMGYYPDIYDSDVKLREAMERIEAVRAPSI